MCKSITTTLTQHDIHRFLQCVNNSVNMHKRLFMLHIDLKLWLLIRCSSLGQTLCATTCTTVFYTDSLISWNWPLMQSKFKIKHGANLKWRAHHFLVGRQFGVAVEHVTAPCPHCFVTKTCETYTDRGKETQVPTVRLHKANQQHINANPNPPKKNNNKECTTLRHKAELLSPPLGNESNNTDTVHMRMTKGFWHISSLPKVKSIAVISPFFSFGKPIVACRHCHWDTRMGNMKSLASKNLLDLSTLSLFCRKGNIPWVQSEAAVNQKLPAAFNSIRKLQTR